ncbi:MAG TPA: hypothetical protein VEU96_11460 [Bryobacteraceae bacterium]|nr:hypothetical protein [Bryobacteraceae bacterium]
MVFSLPFLKKPDSETPTELPPPRATPQDEDRLLREYLGFSVSELKELGCYAASTGSGIAVYVQHLQAIVNARESALMAILDAQAAGDRSRLKMLEEERASSGSESRVSGAVLQSQVDKWNAEIVQLTSDAKAHWRSRRLEERQRLEKERNDAELSWLSGQLTRGEKLLDVAIKGWEANLAEFERQAVKLEGVVIAHENELEKAKARTGRLHDEGITRHVAGFLIWATTATLLGTGIAVTQLLKSALASGQTQDSLLLSWMQKIDTPLQLLGIFGVFLLIIVGAIAAIGASTLAIRKILGTYDPAWYWRAWRRRKGSSDERITSWLGMFSVPGEVTKQGVTDHTLQQLLGYLPLILAGAVIAFLLIAFGDRSANGTSIIASHLGPTFAILTIVAAMLFVTNVVNAAGTNRPLPRLRGVFFGAIGILSPLSLTLVGVLAGQQERYGITAVAVSMTVSGIGLAFGIMYRGQFAHEEYLEREIARRQASIASLRLKPTLAGILATTGFTQRPKHRSAPLPGVPTERFWRSIWGPFRRSRHRSQIDSPFIDNNEEERLIEGLTLSPEQRVALNTVRIKRDLAREQLTRLTTVQKEYAEVSAKLAEFTTQYQNQHRDLKIAYECAILALESAFDIAKTSLKGPNEQAFNATAGSNR